jgi:hypothetical protein
VENKKMQELTLEQIQEKILETQEDKTLNEMYIHKSPCAENEVGAVFFAINGVPPKGYAMYLPNETGNKGALHVFDNLGLKRKIIHCVIKDLANYKASDIWDPKKAMPIAQDD